MSSLRTSLKRYPTVVATVGATLLLGALAFFIHTQFGSTGHQRIDDELSGSTVGAISATTAASSLIEAPREPNGLAPSIATVLAVQPVKSDGGQPGATSTARIVVLPAFESASRTGLRNELRPGFERHQKLSSGGRAFTPRTFGEDHSS